MSFLCVLTSQENPSSTVVDKNKLSQLLCPYVGNIEQVSIDGGVVYLSELAAFSAKDGNFSCLVPKGSKKNAQTAWLELGKRGETLRFETDPLGTFPLWYLQQNDRLIITSEVKSLMALLEPVSIELDYEALNTYGKRPANFSPYRHIQRVPPGALVEVDLTSGNLLSIDVRHPLEYRPSASFECIAKGKEQLAEALKNSSRSIAGESSIGSENWASFLSGGIDSSIATSLQKSNAASMRSFTLGTEFGDEYRDAKELADHLDIQHHEVFANETQAIEFFQRAIFCNEVVDGLSAETLAQLGILAQAAEHNVKQVITGYGADLLFGSMLRHELYMQVTGVDDLQSLIERTCWTGEFSPFFAWSLGIEMHHLFWDPAVMNCAFQIPDQANFDGGREKVPLRSMAVEQELMEYAHAFRKKHAMTDGTQFNRVLSNAFQLPNPHAYGEKDQLCIEVLEQLFQGSQNPSVAANQSLKTNPNKLSMDVAV